MTLREHLPSPPVEGTIPSDRSAVTPPVGPATAKPTVPAATQGATAASPPTSAGSQTFPGSPPRTRISATWFGVCAAALTLTVLIVFMLQNTRSVEVSFLWLHGSVPLALALLVASVGTAIAVIVVGAARITQLRRHTSRSR